ncbi:MAG TPA: NUDIX domain-containing protein [Verrucomicrobiales bacterium]|nr:NUDIX domain-containing protein [Verrucomicrobiales bacterium]
MPPLPQKVAAVCCRPVLNGNVMFLLVRSRGGNRWTFPKGTVEPGESLSATAAREAMEEAGVTGTVDPAPLGTYRKVVPARRFVESGDDEEVTALLFLYSGARSTGEPGRRPTWFLHERAAMAFRSNPDDPIYREQLCAILDAAKARLYPTSAAQAVSQPVQDGLV